jgi:hypothetical protein
MLPLPPSGSPRCLPCPFQRLPARRPLSQPSSVSPRAAIATPSGMIRGDFSSSRWTRARVRSSVTITQPIMLRAMRSAHTRRSASCWDSCGRISSRSSAMRVTWVLSLQRPKPRCGLVSSTSRTRCSRVPAEGPCRPRGARSEAYGCQLTPWLRATRLRWPAAEPFHALVVEMASPGLATRLGTRRAAQTFLGQRGCLRGSEHIRHDSSECPPPGCRGAIGDAADGRRSRAPCRAPAQRRRSGEIRGRRPTRPNRQLSGLNPPARPTAGR